MFYRKRQTDEVTLAEAAPGCYEIVGMTGAEVCGRLRRLGVKVGDRIEVIKSGPGPVIFLKGNTRIGIGRGLAAAITVKSVRSPDEAV
ncbi:MAG TPA: FeoA family protein [bacterium]|nr:FeoA family protein [bacterium]HOL68271.1 FeoA family protein [bacterium]HPP13368.1 FeoA family protein [bacterium]